MAILQKLKSILGLDDGSERSRERDVGITVERESGASSNGNSTERPPPMSARSRGSDAEEATDVGDGPETSGVDTDTVDDVADDEPTQELVDEAEAGEVEPADSEADEGESVDREREGRAAADASADVPDEPDADAEPAADTGPADAEGATDSEAAGSETAESETTEPTDEETPEPDERESVVEIKGIGPAYADRLADAGVGYVDELAAADAEELSEETDISATRIQGWIDRAAVR